VDPADAAREHVLDAHRDTVAAVLAAADETVASLDEPAPREAVASVLATVIDDDLRMALVDMLRGSVTATGRDLLAEPVPASPYLVVTARGPLVRATLADGRLVVLLRAFRRGAGGYGRADVAPSEAVVVRFRRNP
jgi:hypothetical protein